MQQDNEKLIANLRAENAELLKRIEKLERGRRDRRGRFAAQPGAKFGIEFNSDGRTRSMRIVALKPPEPDPNPNTHEKIFARMDRLAAEKPEPDEPCEPKIAFDNILFCERNQKT